MAIEAVIFDIGNVLIEWQPERFYDEKIGVERRKALFAEVDLHSMNDRVDRGAPFQETIYGTAEDHPDFRDEVRMWFDHWAEMAKPEIPHSIRLLRALRQSTLSRAGRIRSALYLWPHAGGQTGPDDLPDGGRGLRRGTRRVAFHR